MGQRNGALKKNQLNGENIVIYADQISEGAIDEHIKNLIESETQFRTVVISKIKTSNCPSLEMIIKLLPKVFLSVSLYLENGEVELEEKILLKLVRKLKTVDTRKLKYEKDGLDVAIYRGKISYFDRRKSLKMMTTLRHGDIPEVYLGSQKYDENGALNLIGIEDVRYRSLTLSENVSVLNVMKLARVTNGWIFVQIGNDQKVVQDFCDKLVHAVAKMGTDILNYDKVDIHVYDKCWSVYDEYMFVTLEKDEHPHVSMDLSGWDKEITSQLIEKKEGLKMLKRLDFKNAVHFNKEGSITALIDLAEDIRFNFEFPTRALLLKSSVKKEMDEFDKENLKVPEIKVKIHGESISHTLFSRTVIRPIISLPYLAMNKD